MVILQQITSVNASAFKTVRLNALQDSPASFGSTYARESQYTDADWLKRAADWNSHRSIGYLAKDAGIYCGIAAAFLNENEQAKAQLISMWVAATHRRTGIGLALVGAVRQWARSCGARTLQLTVTNSNRTAIEFYERIGFSMTGNTEPYPNDPGLFEYEMSQSLEIGPDD